MHDLPVEAVGFRSLGVSVHIEVTILADVRLVVLGHGSGSDGIA